MKRCGKGQRFAEENESNKSFSGSFCSPIVSDDWGTGSCGVCDWKCQDPSVTMSNHDAYHIYCLSSTIQVFTKLIIAKSYCRLLPPLICLLDWGPFLSSSNGCFSPFIGHQIWSNLHSYEWVVDGLWIYWTRLGRQFRTLYQNTALVYIFGANPT